MANDGSTSSWANLIEGVSRQDHQAFTRLYQNAHKRVLHTCRRIVPIPVMAEDALQETFLKVWLQAHQFDPSRGSAAGWLERIARNTALDQLRLHQRSPMENMGDASAETLAPPALHPESQLQVERHSVALRQAMAELHANRRHSLQLVYFEGLSHRQLAMRLQRPLGTVKSWIRLGVHQLRDALTAASDHL